MTNKTTTAHKNVKISITKRNNTPNGINDGTIVYHAMAADQDGRDVFGAIMGRGPSEGHAIADFVARAQNAGLDTYGMDFDVCERSDRTTSNLG